MLLDTAATNSTTNSLNTCISGSVRKCNENDILYAKTNGGLSVFDEIGDLQALSLPMYYNPDSLTTILSFKEIYDLEGTRIAFSNDENAFYFIFKESGRIMKFIGHSCGLYYYDTENLRHTILNLGRLTLT